MTIAQNTAGDRRPIHHVRGCIGGLLFPSTVLAIYVTGGVSDHDPFPPILIGASLLPLAARGAMLRLLVRTPSALAKGC